MYRQWCLEIHFVVYSWVDNIPGYIIYGDIDSESSLASPFDQNPRNAPLSELFLQLRYICNTAPIYCQGLCLLAVQGMLKVMFLRSMLCLYFIDQTLLVNGADFEIQLWFSLHSILLDNVFDVCTTQASPSTMYKITLHLHVRIPEPKHV